MLDALRRQRLVTAMVTPMLPDGAIDWESVVKLAKHLAATGTEAILLGGTTGEGPTLTLEEKKQLVHTVHEALGPDLPLWVSLGTNNTQTSVEQANALAALPGLHAVLAVVPYYNKPPQAGMLAHFIAVADACGPTPVVVYNIPGRCSARILPATTKALAEACPNVIGIKQSLGDFEDLTELRQLLPPQDFMIWSGDDCLTLPMLSIGAQGVVSVSSHVAGEALNRMVYHHLEGRVDEAWPIHQTMMPIFQDLFRTSNPILLKATLAKLGIIQHPTLRLPLLEAKTEEELHWVQLVLDQLEVVKGLTLAKA